MCAARTAAPPTLRRWTNPTAGVFERMETLAALREEWTTMRFSSAVQIHDETEAFVERLFARAEAAERERDLARAHDSQPYPTAEAYEKVCAALEKAKARVAALEAGLEALYEQVPDESMTPANEWPHVRDALERARALLAATGRREATT